MFLFCEGCGDLDSVSVIGLVDCTGESAGSSNNCGGSSSRTCATSRSQVYSGVSKEWKVDDNQVPSDGLRIHITFCLPI